VAIALAAVGGMSLAAGTGAYYYFHSVAAGKAAEGFAVTGVHSQFSSAEIRVDLVIKTHHA
jgi:hypothetical protein